MSTFYGAIIKPGKPTAFVPPPDMSMHLHLSQATLSASVPEGKRVSLMLKMEEQEIIIATLTAGRLDSVNLDLFLGEYAEFSVTGGYEVHLAGYFSPMDDDVSMGGGDEDDQDGIAFGDDSDGEEGESEDDEAARAPAMHVTCLGLAPGCWSQHTACLWYEQHAVPAEKGAVVCDEDGEEDEMDEMEEGSIQAMLNGHGKSKPSVVIKELGDGDDDSEGEDDEGESEEGESEEEEEEAAPAPMPAKRPAEQQAVKGAAQPAKKAAVEAKQAPQTPQLAAKPVAVAAKSEQKPAAAKVEAKPAPKSEQKAPKPAAAGTAAGEVKTSKKAVRRWENGFEIEELAMGPPAGKLAKSGKKVSMRYVGRLKANGKVFDKTAGNATFSFRLGVGEVIKGWDLGVEGMRVGDKRRLVIPPQLGYKAEGVRGTIPPNATLEFDVELVDVK
ncbi:MAG: hypothetical protein WDW36_010282 [Sanguina aurantia]